MSESILVVEDNEDNRTLVVKVLRREGYEVREAVSAEQALAAAAELPPDLILLDLNLVGMSGFEAAGRLKADPTLRHIPVVALTAYAMVGDRERALEAGCDGYISKPVDVRRLADQLREFLVEEKR